MLDTPQPARHIPKKLLSAAGVGLAVALAVFFFQKPAPSYVQNGVPIPFATQSSGLQGAVTSMGTRGGIEVFEVTFTSGQDAATLQADKIYLVHIPNSSSIVNAPIDNVLQSTVPGALSVNYFGYRYSDAAATLERRDQFATRFADRFPGQFFASDKAKTLDAQHDDSLHAFEVASGITFVPTSNVSNGARIDSAGALYVFIVNDAEGAVMNPYVHGVCGNGIPEGSEQCDDGNTDNADNCRNDCTLGTPIPFNGSLGGSSASASSFSSSSASLTSSESASSSSASEEVTSSSSASEEIFSSESSSSADSSTSASSDSSASSEEISSSESSDASVASSESSSIAAPFCGDGVINGDEECDDGNSIDADDCSNSCTLTIPIPSI